MSIFFIAIIAAHRALRPARVGVAEQLEQRVGTTCHDTPNRSLSQPHGPSSPPSVSRVQ